MYCPKAKELNWPLISRALNNHDVDTAYTLLSEQYTPLFAGLVLSELIETVPNWPKTRLEKGIGFTRRLSHRELEVLRHAEQGFSKVETAKEMFLSYHTIKSHRKNIFNKLEVTTITQAIHRAHELGLIT